MNTAQPYERPGIVRHQIGALNKFGQPTGSARPDAHRRRRDRRAVPRVRLAAVRLLRAHAGRAVPRLEQAFARRYPRCGWPGRTRPTTCRRSAACSTGGRLRRGRLPVRVRQGAARWASRPTASTSTGRTSPTTRSRARSPAADPPRRQPRRDRADRAHRRSGRAPRAVAIRVNMSIDGVQSWSRFGLNLESGQAHEAITRMLGGAGDRSDRACTRTSARSCKTRRPTARRREDGRASPTSCARATACACRSSISAAVSRRRTR